MRGGAERVLRVFSQMFPDAPIYTLLYDEKKLGTWFPKERVRTSSLQPHFPFSIFNFSFNHHLHLSRFPPAVEAWDFSEFDLVLSSSSAFVHGIITNSAPRHLCYVQSPARYLWDRTHDVLERAGRGVLGPLRRSYLSKKFHLLRIWDSEAADRPDRLLAASKEVQRRIELYWRRESDVIHPPIDDFWLQPSNHPTLAHRSLGEGGIQPSNDAYYLIVSQLVPYKRIDLAIRACNERKARLIIAGEGPAKRSLQSIAGPTVEFVGYRTDAELKELYRTAVALLLPGEEDFGLTPIESLACGTPVIAFNGGGVRETLTAETAEFFDVPTSESLSQAMARAAERRWDPAACAERAQQFSRTRFEEQIHRQVAAMMHR